MAAKRNLILSHEQIAMLRIPNRVEAFSCYAWMHSHFECVGDQIPNSPGEIHLEPITIREVWQEYCEDMDAVCCGSGCPIIRKYVVVLFLIRQDT